ncbi:MAG: YneF family protein [Bacilli bacterium]|nr:YneF family protein [Bacilli bacterium]
MWMNILWFVIGLLIGAVIGFFVCRKVMTSYLKKNPPINEEMIKALMLQMGRKPNQKQINQIMKQMNKFN